MTPRGALRPASRVSSPSVPPFSKVYSTQSALNTPAPMNSGKTFPSPLQRLDGRGAGAGRGHGGGLRQVAEVLDAQDERQQADDVTTDSSRTIAHWAIRPRMPIRAMFHPTAITAAITMMISSVWKLGARLNSGWISVGQARVVRGHQREHRHRVDPAQPPADPLAGQDRRPLVHAAGERVLGRELGDHEHHRADADRDQRPAPELDAADAGHGEPVQREEPGEHADAGEGQRTVGERRQRPG